MLDDKYCVNSSSGDKDSALECTKKTMDANINLNKSKLLIKSLLLDFL